MQKAYQTEFDTLFLFLLIEVIIYDSIVDKQYSPFLYITLPNKIRAST